MLLLSHSYPRKLKQPAQHQSQHTTVRWHAVPHLPTTVSCHAVPHLPMTVRCHAVPHLFTTVRCHAVPHLPTTVRWHAVPHLPTTIFFWPGARASVAGPLRRWIAAING